MTCLWIPTAIILLVYCVNIAVGARLQKITKRELEKHGYKYISPDNGISVLFDSDRFKLVDCVNCEKDGRKCTVILFREKTGEKSLVLQELGDEAAVEQEVES